MTDQQIHATMLNGYNLLINKETYAEAIHRNKCERVFYPFPIDDITIHDIRTVIEYFEHPTIEEYEKCNKLMLLIKKWKMMTK